MNSEQAQELVRSLSEHKRKFDPDRKVPAPEKRAEQLEAVRVENRRQQELSRLRWLSQVEFAGKQEPRRAKPMSRIAVDWLNAEPQAEAS